MRKPDRRPASRKVKKLVSDPPAPTMTEILGSRGVAAPTAMKALVDSDMLRGTIRDERPGGVTHKIKPDAGGRLVSFSNRHVRGGGKILNGARVLYHPRIDDPLRADVVIIL